MRGDEVVHSTQPQVHRLLVGPLHKDVATVKVTVLKPQSLDGWVRQSIIIESACNVSQSWKLTHRFTDSHCTRHLPKDTDGLLEGVILQGKEGKLDQAHTHTGRHLAGG